MGKKIALNENGIPISRKAKIGLKKRVVKIYTDGSASCGRNVMAFAWVIVLGWRNEHIYGEAYEIGSNNANRAELKAVIEGLRHLRDFSKGEYYRQCKIIVRTDSKFVVDGYKYLKHHKKPRNNNVDLWERLRALKIDKLEIIKIKGHSGIHFNVEVDRNAKRMLQEGIARENKERKSSGK